MSVPTHDELMAMTDEEFLNFQASTSISEPEVEHSGEAAPVVLETETEGNEEEQPETEQEENPIVEGEEEQEEAPAVEQPVAEGTEQPVAEKPVKQVETPAVTEQTPEQFRDAILAPLRANKRDIKINNVEEARQLMSKGANYGLKMQQLAPHLKTIQMLNDNGISNPEELAYLIDLRNKNPEAIQKLLKDSQFDTLGFDPEAQTDYKPTTAVVTDRQAQFREVVDDLVLNHETGIELIQSLHQHWDSASQEMLADDTSRLYSLNQHKQNGVYDVIMNEVQRQRTLGNIPASMTTIEAYTRIGDHIRDNGGFDQYMTPEQIAAQQQRQLAAQPAPVQTQPARQPVARRVATPKSPVQNNDKAKAAASTAKPSGRQPSMTVDDISKMTDSEFMKTFSGRL